jgi:fucose 4-O-acetylase-like acetyltransferase
MQTVGGGFVSSSRRAWVDCVRGLSIFLVVIGHTLRGLGAAGLLSNSPLWRFVDRFIYAFHMPLFFVVAGLFLVPAADESFLGFARRRVVRLGYPYLLWATLQTLAQVLLSRYTNHDVGAGDLLAIGFQPPMQFWFLYALLLQTLFLGLLARLGLGRTALLAVSVLIFLSAPYLSLGPWSPLYQARSYLIYTALGVYLGAPQRIGLVDASPSRSALGFSALFGYLLVGVAVFHQGIPVEARLWALAVACVGIVASVGLCVLLLQLTSPLARFTSARLLRWGEASMAIFVAHTLASAAVRVFLVKALHIENAAVQLVLGTAAGIGLPLALLVFSKRFHLPYLFEWPTRPRRVPLGRSSRPTLESPAA